MLDKETPLLSVSNAGTVDALLPATIHNQTNRKPIPEYSCYLNNELVHICWYYG